MSDGAYTAWGASNNASYPSTPFCWKGQGGAYRDSETGLFLMGARYYAPAIGRFLSRDPSGFSSGVNLYGFCGGDPINFFDPDGERPRSLAQWWEQYSNGTGWFSEQNYFLNVVADGFRQLARQQGPAGNAVAPVPSMTANAFDSWRRWGTLSGSSKASPEAVIAAGMDAASDTAALGLAIGGPLGNQVESLEESEGEVAGVEAGGGRPKTQRIDPFEVKFGQKGVTWVFGESQYNIGDTAQALRDGTLADLRPIQVIESEGNLVTLDNRRLLAYRTAGRTIPYVMVNPEDPEIAAQIRKKLDIPGGHDSPYIRHVPNRLR